MPALQVRDFPDSLYTRLKERAESEHRSIAQQTIVAVEQMLSACDQALRFDADCARGDIPSRRGSKPCSSGANSDYVDSTTTVDRAARISRRKALFAEADSLFEEKRAFLPTASQIVGWVRDDRDRGHGFDGAASGSVDLNRRSTAPVETVVRKAVKHDRA